MLPPTPNAQCHEIVDTYLLLLLVVLCFLEKKICIKNRVTTIYYTHFV